MRLVVYINRTCRELVDTGIERLVDRDRWIEAAIQLRDEHLLSSTPGLVFPGVAAASGEGQLVRQLVVALRINRRGIRLLAITEDVRRVVPCPERQRAVSQVKEAKQLVHAEINVFMLVEGAGDEVERATEVR